MEKWVDIKGFEGLYQVSNKGNVKSMNYNHTKTEKELKKGTDSDGYYLVVLVKNKKKSVKKVHRLVADAFIPNPSNLPFVNHKDEVKTNNFVENLEWCDNKYNCNYGSRTKRIKEKLTNRKDQSKPLYQYTIDEKLIKIWSSRNEAVRNGFNKGGIYMATNGIYKTYKGYKWSYEPL